MQVTLTFIIPLISKEITDRWDLVYANLKKTLASVENQTNSNWRANMVVGIGNGHNRPEPVILINRKLR